MEWELRRGASHSSQRTQVFQPVVERSSAGLVHTSMPRRSVGDLRRPEHALDLPGRFHPSQSARLPRLM